MSFARLAIKKATSVVAVLSMVAVGLTVGVVAAPLAAADPLPLAQRTTSMATADVLPTVQIDGVVWSQAIVGNTVYAGGQFANARPAGAAPGTNLTPRANLLSYNLTTGALNTSFAPSTNGAVQTVAVSPDKSRVYIGGLFTQANGQNRYRMAAYDATTGALVTTFKPIIGNWAKSIVATNTTVYVGGSFTSANGVSRSNLAAFSAVDGSLLAWAPTADAVVNSLVMSPDGTKIIAGGSFQNVNGSPAYGLAAIDSTTGALLPWAATNSVRNAGANAGIFSLSTDGTSIVGTGWVYGAGGNLEGTFSADPNTGNINWVEDCHGDTYGAYSDGSTVYTVSHAHYCSTVGGFYQSDPWSVNQRHALAFSATATGTLGHNIYGGYKDWAGTPSPTMYNWFPDPAFGNYTTQGQAAWTVTGSGDYVVMGGEFPSVSGVAQQGIVRFAKPNVAPKKERPRLSGPNFLPTLVALPDGRVRVSWQSNWDRDDLTLDYKVYRNNSTTPIYTTTADAPFWNRPTIGFIDSGLTPGATYQYKVSAFDKDGNVAAGSNVSIAAPAAGTQSAYAAKVTSDGAAPFWRMGESTGTTLLDSNGFIDGTTGSGVTRGTPGAILGDSDTATTFDGTSNGTASSPTAIAGPDTFTVETWFKTTTTSGGKIIGFGNSSTGNSGSYDRHVYMDNSGKLYFGVYTGNFQTLKSGKSYNDGQWHQVVASMGPAGMALYVDDALVGNRTDTTAGQAYAGFWRVGGDTIGGWPGAPSSAYFAGAIDDVSIYNRVLTRADIDAHYVASGRSSTLPVAPADAYGAGVFNDNPSLYWRLGDSTGDTAADSGQIGEPGIYSGGVTKGVAGAIPGTTNTAARFDGVNGLVVSSDSYSNPTQYSEELWFNTTTNQGGKLIGFGNSQSGTSGSYDRHVYMETGGQLTFGTYTGQLNTITSPLSYNNGSWHHLVATQSATDGMKLYVDGALVGQNPQTGAQAYDGYWRVGGDTTWNGTDPYWQGTIDEVAIYPSAMTAAQVAQHYANAAGAPNQNPVAAFIATPTGLTAAFDGSGSADPDGSIASYAWDFGDSTAGTGANPSHPYAAAGTYQVTLTVTDNKGGTSSVTHPVTVAATNQNPVAAFTATPTGLTAAFDGSGSADPDGSIASYAWDFGDTASGTGISPSHSYASGGTYPVTLTVTDNQGATNSVSHSVTVAANQVPVASFTSSSTSLVAALDGTASADSDGTIASYSWDFGDNTAAGTGVKPSHTYAAAGSYDVTLTVKDNQGAVGTFTDSVVVTVANQAPEAAFTSTTAGLTATLNGTTSVDHDGSVAAYAWNFGDTSAAGTGATTSHTYAAAGTYHVTLTVTDNKGATGVITQDVMVAVVNKAPTASFTASASGLVASLDATAAADPDGTIASYAWNFGDNQPAGAGVTTSHTYAAAGTYTVTLTVTDNQGATGSTTRQVVATAPQAGFASDLFARTVSGGWGTADQGGPWAVSGTGGAANFSVAAGSAKLRMPSAGATDAATLSAVSQTGADVRVAFTSDLAATGGGMYFNTAVRRVGSNFYTAKTLVGSTGKVTLYLAKTVSGTETVLKSAVATGITFTPGMVLRVRLQAIGSGTTTLNAKVWQDGQAEPATWLTTATDTTAALQAPGAVGVIGYMSGTATNAPVTWLVKSFTAGAPTP